MSATPTYATVVVLLSTTDVEYEREYGKLDDTLSYVGGLFSLVIVFLGFFFMSFNEYRYELFVGETFNLNDGNKVKEEDFNFLVYVKYAIYDWLRTFGCCNEPDW